MNASAGRAFGRPLQELRPPSSVGNKHGERWETDTAEETGAIIKSYIHDAQRHLQKSVTGPNVGARTRAESVTEMAAGDPMDIMRVRYFLAVCEHGSITAAAKACGVSQPSVTTGVARLERAMGGKLFQRCRPFRLTPLGAELRPLLQELQSVADRVAAVVDRTYGNDFVADGDNAKLLGPGARAAEVPSRSGREGFEARSDERDRPESIELSSRRAVLATG